MQLIGSFSGGRTVTQVALNWLMAKGVRIGLWSMSQFFRTYPRIPLHLLSTACVSSRGFSIGFLHDYCFDPVWPACRRPATYLTACYAIASVTPTCRTHNGVRVTS